MNYLDYFKGKKITLIGLGLLGRGVGDAKFLADGGADLIVTDLKTEKELAPSLKQLKKYRINYVLGTHRLEDFRVRDLIIKAAGVPLNSPVIAEAKKNKIPVMMSVALFAKLSGAQIIGVTGTRGKTTTTQLIYEILFHGLTLKAKNPRVTLNKPKVWLGGNIQGISTLALLPKVKSGDWVVLELDSWQLQGFGDLKISPEIAVFTNLMPDHWNYYHSSMAKYFTDKANIFRYQQPSDYLVVGQNIAKKIKAAKPRSQMFLVGEKSVPKNWKVKLPGSHNLNNIGLAIKVGEILGVPKSQIKQVVENFAGVSGRLELMRTWRGFKIYNDTTATTPEATLVALRALAKKRNIVLIMGGADKNLPLDKLVKNLPKFCKAVILLPGTGTEKFKSYKLKVINLKEVSNLAEAIEEAIRMAKSGDILLFSPGFASFGPPPGGFKNEYDRGAQFNKLVKNLK